MQNTNKKFIVVLGVVGVSFSAIFVKYATAPSVVLAFYRMLFAAVLLFPIILKKHMEELRKLPIKSIGIACVSGFFLALHFTAYFESIRYTSIASSTVLVDTEVFFVALVTIFIFREKISKRGLLGIGFTFVGSVILALSDRSGGSNILYGDLLAVSGALFVSVYTLIGRYLRKSMTTTLYTFIVYGFSALTLVIICAVSGTAVTGYGNMNYLWGLLLTLCCTFFGHSVFSWGLKYVPAAFISTAKLGEPVFATILGILLFGQMPKPMQIIGGVIIIAGLYIYTCRENEEK